VKTLVSRVLGLALAITVAMAALVPVAPAHAASSDPREFIPGAIVLKASVTGPGLAAPRTLTADNAGRFMASWLAYSIYGNPVIETPPKNAIQYRVMLRQRWRAQQGNITVLYAMLGSSAWVTMPAPQSLGWAFVTTPHWIRAQVLTINAFHTATGSLPSVSAGSAAAGAKKSSGSASSAWIWIVVGAAVVVIFGLVFVVRRRQRT
jgi:hypothetical protein